MKPPKLSVAPLNAVQITSFTLEGTDVLKLSWRPVTGVNPLGYVIKWGTQPGHYTESLDCGLHTVTAFTDLEKGQTYYFVIGTHLQKGRLVLSEELSYNMPLI